MQDGQASTYMRTDCVWKYYNLSSHADNPHIVCKYIWLETWGQFQRAAEPVHLRLAQIGYQPNWRVIYVASSWFSAQFCLAVKFTNGDVSFPDISGLPEIASKGFFFPDLEKCIAEKK